MVSYVEIYLWFWVVSGKMTGGKFDGLGFVYVFILCEN